MTPTPKTRRGPLPQIARTLADARALGRAAKRDHQTFPEVAADAGVPLRPNALAAIPLTQDLGLLTFAVRDRTLCKRGRKTHPEVGEVIRAVRVASGITQTQLADRSDIHNVTISNIETGKVSPSVDIIRKIAAGLGVLAGDLI